MKVKDLIKSLSELNPEDEVCALWWEKKYFEYGEDDEVELTSDGWGKVCSEFDDWDNAGTNLTQWISEAVTEHAVARDYAS